MKEEEKKKLEPIKSSVEQHLEEQISALMKERENLLMIINSQLKQINSLKNENDKSQVTIDALQEKLIHVVKLYNTLLNKENKEETNNGKKD